jgi:hypothetical protein
MPHNRRKTSAQAEEAEGFTVARWLIMALPQDLADALDWYTASLGLEVTSSEAIRRVLQDVLLGRALPR